MQAKKSLGQNFLTSTAARAHIIEAGTLSASDTVLEIGPGKGFLTEALLATGARVVAIEKDDRMIPYLSEKFAAEISAGKLKIIHGDVLEFSPETSGLAAGKYKLIANIPYYLTGAIFRKFFEEKNQPERMVLMVQKEVAERIVARDGKESILSVSVKAYGEPHIVSIVKAGSFVPAPNVDSAIIAIENISKKNFAATGVSEEKFFNTVRAAFAGKRKMLAGNLRTNLVVPQEKIEKAFQELGLDPKIRAEDVPVELWIKIAERI